MAANRAPGARRLSARATLLCALSLCAPALPAQIPGDPIAMPRGTIGVGVQYASDVWREYWEGTLRRSNDNIGTLRTQATTTVLAYGASDRLTLSATLPYVTTNPSGGTHRGIGGVQDLGVAARYRVLTTPFTSRASLSAIAVGALAAPATRYTPDDQPFSIGSGSRRATARLVLDLQSSAWWFVGGSAGYTWRRNVMLDRSAYFTNGQLYLTNEVEMPDVRDWALSAGYRRGRLAIPLMLAEQRTLGGGDIRRQDMPFVSNRMDFTRAGGAVMYTLRVPEGTMLELGAMRTLDGRNVGQSTTVTAGVVFCIRR